MTLEAYTKKINEQTYYKEKSKPFEMRLTLLEEGKKAAIRKIEKEYLNLLKHEYQEMNEKIGCAPICNHDLLIVGDVLTGDYFLKQKIAYCPCCKTLIDGAFIYKAKHIVSANNTLNEDEFKALIEKTDSLIEKISADNPEYTLEDISDFLNEEVKIQVR